MMGPIILPPPNPYIVMVYLVLPKNVLFSAQCRIHFYDGKFDFRLKQLIAIPKVIFHQKLSSTEGRLPLKVVFHRWLSSTEGCLPLKVVFHLL